MLMSLEELGFSQGHRKKLAVDEQILNSAQMFPDATIPWQKVDKIYEQVTLYKSAQSITGNALDVIDHSDDDNASVYIEYSGNSTGKDLIHVEMTTAMTQCRVGVSIEQEAGICSALASFHAKAGTVTDVLYLENDTTAGNCIHAWNDDASNTDPVIFLRSDGVQTSHFYVMAVLDCAGTFQPKLWITDGDDPDGTLSGTAGDICMGLDGGGNHILSGCQGGTTWATYTAT